MKLRIPFVLSTALAVAACSQAPDRSPSSAAGMPAAARVAVAVPVAQGSTAGLAGGPAALATMSRFASQPDRGGLVAYPAKPVVRSDGAYTWHRADLSEAHARAAIGGTLSLRSPSGEALSFRYERHVEHDNGDWTWIGELAGATGREAIITFGAKAAFGTIAQATGEPLRLTLKDGQAWLVETDPARVALIENRATRPSASDSPLPGVVSRDAAVDAGATRTASGAAAAADASGNTIVDLVLGYTPGFVTYYGGDSQAQTRLNNLVDITNEGYANSQIPARVRLVKTLRVDYTDLNKNDTALEELTGYKSGTGGGQTNPNAAFAALRQARETYGADLVSLVRPFNDPEHDGCGIAWLNGGGQRTITQNDAYFGYSVVSDGRDQGTDGKTYFCRDETLAHELGHNMGAAHDRTTSMGTDGVLQSNEYGAFAYSFGYKTTAVNGNFYTIMAYGDSGQTRYRVFSNPRINLCGGAVCGIEGQADNARTLTQTIPTIATFRATATPTTPPPATRKVVRDLNGDGRSDLVWQNTASGDLGAWLMNGATLSSSIANGSLPAGTAAIAIGDYNGDGYADVMSVSAANVYLSLGSGSGGLASPVSVSTRPPAGWNLAGAGDVNGDGKADVVWHNIASGEIYYWLMNGASIAGGQGASYLPVGSIALAVADFNGDGRVDVLSTTSQDTRVSIMGANGVYGAATVVTGRPSSAWNFAGAGDITGDGKADVVWHNLTSGELYYWVMDGTAIAGGQGLAYLPQGAAALALADFNGDGRSDIVSTTAFDVRVSLAQANGAFAAPAVVASRPAAGWRFVDSVEKDRVPPKADINGDGRSDIGWIAPGNGGLLSWLMQGPTVLSQQSGMATAADAAPLAMADFDGDGRADLLSANASDVWVSPGNASGGFGTAVRVQARPQGAWVLVGAGDATGDGKADVVWHNLNTGELYTWVMSGATITGGHGSVFAPLGSQGVTLNDFNGDGRMDVLTLSATEVRVSLAQSSGGFGTSLFVSTRPATGWNFAGAGDVNGDGKADVIWHNVNSGELYYWLMVSNTILGGQGGAYLPIGSTVLAATDYSGDGRADIASLSGGTVNISVMQPSGLFTAPASAGPRAGGNYRFAPVP